MTNKGLNNTLPSSALDLVLYAMTTVTFTINMYYYTQNELSKHIFEPSNICLFNYINLELVHWNRHYDLVTGTNSE